MTPQVDTRNAGSALLAVIVFMIILTIFASALVSLVNTNITAANRAVNRMENMALAEGGIAKAAVLLRTDPAYRGEPYFALGKGEVMIQVDPVESSGRYMVATTARQSVEDPAPARIDAELAVTGAGLRIVRWKESAR